MIPNIQNLTTPITTVTSPNRTYKILVENNKIRGYIDDLEAVMQSIYLILNIERYRHNIYSWNYGVELLDLYGKPMPYVVSEAERRIREALLQDDRISEVKNFEFERTGKTLHVTFDVVTKYGTVQAERELFGRSTDPSVIGTLVWLNSGTLVFNTPSFNTDNILALNDPSDPNDKFDQNNHPTLDENGTLIY